MQLTKKAIEKKYNVILERGEFNMCDSYLSWKAYALNEKKEPLDGIGYEIGWGDTLAELVSEIEEYQNKK